ncbi:MAG: HigA family addiction module antitoxin [Geminicoccaceae bacterium]
MTTRSEAVTGAMANPPHPGELVRYDCLEPLNLTVTAGAKVLGVSRKALDNLVNGRAGVSPEMAVRLAAAFGGTPRAWINMQAAYDYAQVAKRAEAIRATVQPLHTAAPHEHA